MGIESEQQLDDHKCWGVPANNYIFALIVFDNLGASQDRHPLGTVAQMGIAAARLERFMVGIYPCLQVRLVGRAITINKPTCAVRAEYRISGYNCVLRLNRPSHFPIPFSISLLTLSSYV